MKALYSTVKYGKGITNDSHFIERVLSSIREFMQDDGRESVYRGDSSYPLVGQFVLPNHWIVPSRVGQEGGGIPNTDWFQRLALLGLAGGHEIPSNLCDCTLSRQRGFSRQYASANFTFLARSAPSIGCMKKYRKSSRS